MACMKLLAIVFLAISSFNFDQIFLVQGRRFTKFSVPTQSRIDDEENGRLIIGSRPPRCERICTSCGHCEAVQVPLSPASTKYIHHSKMSHFFSSATNSVDAYSRGDDISNYKPMCWKCKCGDFIFNP